MRENNFDLIRLLAAMGVFFAHGLYFYQSDFPNFFKNNANIGTVSVYIFFMVSGFLIYGSLKRSDQFYDFLVKRIFRIFPGLFFASLFSVFFIGIIASKNTPLEFISSSLTWKTFFNYISAVGFQHNLPGVFEENIIPGAVNGSLWTIKYEFFCYLILLFVFKVKRFFDLKKSILIGLMICIFVIACNLTGSFFKIFDIYNFFLFLFCFFLGSLAAIFRFQDQSKLNLLFASLVFLGLSFFMNSKNSLDLIFSFCLLFFCLSVAFCKLSFHLSMDLSYGVYIYAFPIQQLVTEYCLKNGYSLIFCLSFSMAWTFFMAFLSWRLIEKPSLDFAHEIIKRRPAKILEELS